MSVDAIWTAVRDPGVLLAVAVVLFGGLVLRALAGIRAQLERMADTLVSCQQELEELNRGSRRRAKLEREIQPGDRLARRLRGGGADPS